MTDAVDLIRQAERARKTVTLCLDWTAQAAYDDAQADLARAKYERNQPGASLASGGAVERAQAAVDEAAVAVQKAQIEFVLQALTRREWQTIVDQHPPDKGNRSHLMLGYNPDTFFPALLNASLVSPELDDDTFELLIEERLTSGQFDLLIDTCIELSRRKTSIPFSPAASATTEDSDGR